MYQAKARAFAQRELLPGAIERDMTEEFPMDILKKLGDEGLIGIQFDKKYGGKGDDYLSFILVVEELCKVAEVIIENAVVPADRMIGTEGKGFRYALTALNAGRLSVAAQGLGLACGAFEIAREYMKERQQFGKPIYKNQYLAFRMADLQTEIDMCRYLLYKGVWEQQMGMDFAVSACKAKLACTNMAMKVTTECIQSMGGAGYMRKQHVERMFRDAKITQIYEGTNEIQRLIISGAIFA